MTEGVLETHRRPFVGLAACALRLIWRYATVRRMERPRRLVSGPLIGRLLDLHRMTVNEAMRAGRYGQTCRIGWIVYVDLAAVEKSIGATFTDKVIEDAGRGLIEPYIIIKETEAA